MRGINIVTPADLRVTVTDTDQAVTADTDPVIVTPAGAITRVDPAVPAIGTVAVTARVITVSIAPVIAAGVVRIMAADALVLEASISIWAAMVIAINREL